MNPSSSIKSCRYASLSTFYRQQDSDPRRGVFLRFQVTRYKNIFQYILKYYSDDRYQENLPFYARNTASTSIKANTVISEFIENKDILQGQQKVESVLGRFKINKEKVS